MIKGLWWKVLGILLVLYSIIAGLTVAVPDLPVIRETIRNLFYHVPMWFTMFALHAISLVYSIKYLTNSRLQNDIVASEAVYTGLFAGMLGIFTGMIWAKNTWGDYWINDPQLNGAAVSMLAYLAYAILRSAVEDKALKAKLSAVYNIFAFMLLTIFLGVLPRLADSSLHPGKGGNTSTMGTLDPTMRLVLYPAVAGWILIFIWILLIRVRSKKLNLRIENHIHNA